MSKQDVKAFVARRLQIIQSLPDNQRRAELARLRRGVGHAPGELPELWGTFLNGMPEGFLARDGRPSREEWAVYLALTLYAVHQQSQDKPMHRQGSTLGTAVRELAEQASVQGQDWTNSSAVKRFNVLATAESMPEIAHYLRAMIQLLRSAKDGAIPLDYVQLAADLYELQFPDGIQRVRLRWGQDLYRNIQNSKTENEEK